MFGIEMVVAMLVQAVGASYVGVVLLALIPFVVVALVVGTVFVMRQRQKRRTRDM